MIPECPITNFGSEFQLSIRLGDEGFEALLDQLGGGDVGIGFGEGFGQADFEEFPVLDNGGGVTGGLGLGGNAGGLFGVGGGNQLQIESGSCFLFFRGNFGRESGLRFLLL